MNSDGGLKKGRVTKFLVISFPWIIVLLGALLLMSANIYSYTFGVFFKPISENFDWSRAVMSGSYALRSLVGAVFVVPMGYWADRYGPRRILLPCFILIGAGMMVIAKVTTLWQLYMIQGVGIGIGMSGAFVCVVSTVARWHYIRRGLAVGIASAGIGLSSIVFPPVVTQMIHTMGWPFATVVTGLIILAIGIPGSLIIKNPPPTVQQADIGNIARKSSFEARSMLSRYLKNPQFLAIVVIFAIIFAVGNMLISQLVNYATDLGVTPLAAAVMMSVMGVANTAGLLGMGTVSDRIGTKRSATICCVFLAVSFVLLISQLPALLWIATVFFGFGFNGSVPLVPMLMGERVGMQELSTAIGVTNMGMYIGTAVGPWLGGLMFDVTGSYLLALLLSAAASIVALLITLRIPPAGQEILRLK